MRERFDKRILASCALAFFLSFCAIGGMLSFLQDSTDTIQNAFSYGTIGIGLTESVVDELGTPVSPAERTSSGQTYRLIPGRSYVKDPVVTVEADSEPCYVYLLVDNPVTTIEDSSNTIASQIAAAGWTQLASDGTLYVNSRALGASETLYYQAVGSDDEDQYLASFDTLDVDLWSDVIAVDGLSIDVTAFAVQQDGFSSSIAAWEATFGYHYDPTVDYDFGTMLTTGKDGKTAGPGVKVDNELGGSTCGVELGFYNNLIVNGQDSPIFVSNYICITSNKSANVYLWVRDSSSGTSLANSLGVEGTWRSMKIGGWNTNYTIVADGPNIWVNGTLKVSNAECYGWGDYGPQVFGRQVGPDQSAKGGFIYYAKTYTDGVLTMDLAPAQEKTTLDVGLFDLIENVFYKATGDMWIVFG